MKVEKITIETIVVGPKDSPSRRRHHNAVILWTEDGKPHTLPDIDQNIAYVTVLAEDEQFEILQLTESERLFDESLKSLP